MRKFIIVLALFFIICQVVYAGGMVRTEKAFYQPSEQIVVEFMGLPGNQGDWITIVGADVPPDRYGEWFYTNGQRSGTHVFNGLPAGEYEVRVYFDWPAGGYNIMDGYHFKVAGVSATDAKFHFPWASPSFSPGQTMAAKWTDGNWYLAKIESVSGGRYNVLYADGDRGSVAQDQIQVIPMRPHLIAGERVLAVWSGAKFYSGIILEVRGNGAVVKWDDGSTPSLVEYGKILRGAN